MSCSTSRSVDVRSGDPPALTQAIRSGNLEKATKLLLAHTEYANAKDSEGKYPLHWAARRGAVQLASLLLKHGADIDADMKGWTALHEAAYWGQDKMAQLLLKNGADIEARSQTGSTPLAIAAGTRHLTIVKLLVKQGAKVNAKCNKGSTPLYFGVQAKSEQIVTFLLDAGATPNYPEKEFGPLHKAASQGDTGIAELLIKHGAKVNRVAWNGRSALYIATRFGHKETALLLVDKGAILDIISAIFLDLPGDVEKLVNKDETLATQAINWAMNKETALHWAGRMGSHRISSFLLRKGADVDATDLMKRTPPHLAALAGSKDVVQLLLDNNSLIDLKDSDGKSPLFLAAENDRKEVAVLLLKEGADTGTIDSTGKELRTILTSKGFIPE